MEARIAAQTSWPQRILLVGLGLVLAFGLLEVGLRAVGALWLWQRDRWNVAGLEADDTIRVLCIGESTTALGGDGAYPRQLERILAHGGGRTFRVINAGVPGITTDMVLATLEAQLDRNRPHVVVAMLGINDALVDEGRLPPFSSWRVVKLLHLLVGPVRAALGLGGGEDATVRRALADITRGGMEAARASTNDVESESEARAVLFGLLAGRRLEEADAFAAAWLALHPDNRAMRETMWSLRVTKASRAVSERRLDAADDALTQLEQTVPLDLRAERTAIMAERATLATLRGQHDLAQSYRTIAESLRGRQAAATERNYRELLRVLRARGIALVAMQYPLRPLRSLRGLLDDAPDVHFVDNEAVFQTALRNVSWDALFTDEFASDFGHTTAAGSALIASSAAPAVLAAVREMDQRLATVHTEAR